MKRLCTVQVILICLLFNITLYAQIDSPQKHYAYAVDLMENGVYDAAKIEFVKIIHTYAKNEYQDDARYYLGEIAFKENQLEVALHQWERLRKEYPQSPYVKDIIQKITLASELLAKEERTKIEDISIRKLFENAEFLLQRHCSALSVDMSYLPSDLMAEEWYDKVIEKYPNSPYAPEALYRKILIAYGWGEKSIGGYKQAEGWGLIYHMLYDDATEVAKAGVKVSLAEMAVYISTLEQKYPNSYWLIHANFIVGQAHWLASTYFPDSETNLEMKEKAIKHFQRVIELTKDDEFSFYRQTAQIRLKRSYGVE